MSAQVIGESVQDQVRLGMCQDIYYYNEMNSLKQCWPTIVNTKFTQAFTSLGQGTNQFLFSPAQGLTDVICGLKLPSSYDYTNLAVPRGWGYALVDTVNFRYGASSQYFISGQQMLVQNLRECNDAASRDFLFQLGGAEMKQVGDFAGDSLTAYIYINLPHNSPNGDGQKPLPLPTDLLTQPVLISIAIKAFSQVFSSISSAIPPTTFDSAYWQVKQVMMNDAGDLLARRKDLNDGAYSLPVKFYQQEYQQRVSGSTSYSINLTGFRSGEVKAVVLWMTKDSDTSGTTKNPFNYILPTDLTMTYNGDIIHRSDGTSSLLWDLVSSHQYPGVSNSVLSVSGGAFTSDPVNSYYVTMPFAQVYDNVSGVNTLVHGKAISNAIVNLSLTAPDTAAYTVHATYIYNSVLLFTKGSCDYVF